MTRRTFLALAAAASAVSALPAYETTLREAARGNGLFLGTAVSRRQLLEPAFRDLIAHQADIVVCENDMKWGPIHPQPGVYDFTGGDLLMKFAEAQDIALRGHNLCWYEQLPAWFPSFATPANTEELLRLHIATVVGHYKGRVQSWDAVNEAIQVSEKQRGGYRDSIWYRNLGPRYIEIAFRAAAEMDPHAVLTYNDYDLEQDSEAFEAKRAAVLAMLRSLKDKGVPVQALGLQSHLKAGGPAETWEPLNRFLGEIEKLGLQVYVTELDVNDETLPGDQTERDAAVAGMYRSYLSNVLQHKSVRAVLTWGMSDRDTWLNGFKRRKDGLPQRPLPFDASLQPTPVYFAMLEAIRNAPSR